MIEDSSSPAGVAVYARTPLAHAHVTPSAALAFLTPLFSATMLVSAALLFFVEPMFAKMVLPRLGGSPAVWNTCVVFFQATMLAGYAYAHLIAGRLRLWQQVALHVSVLLLVATNLPIGIPEGWTPPVDRPPIPSLLGLLLVTVGGPFFAVSATAPLLQRWFSYTHHPSARDPYFLYAASNVGSLVALLGYPFIVEPSWPLSVQSHGWAAGYLVLAALIGASAAGVFRGQTDVPRLEPAEADAMPTIPRAELTWWQRGRWVALAFVPSSLMLAVTTFISTDIAAVPLLWIAPLALYLLSFVLAFAARALVSQRRASAAMALLFFPLLFAIVLRLSGPLWLLVPLHLVAFFVCALVLHRELASDRPDARHLTEFYLWLSVGGVAGGAFNTFVAPLAFTDVIEYPIVMVLACALSPSRGAKRRSPLDVSLPLALGATTFAMFLFFRTFGVSPTTIGIIGIPGAIYWGCAQRPLRFAAGLTVAFLVAFTMTGDEGNELHAERTFFGVLRVRSVESNGPAHVLVHGSTVHGEQSLNPALRRTPTAYYYQDGPVGQLFSALNDRFRRVGIIGLGTGGLAVYATPEQRWTFYEIDPAVERIARDTQFFTYLEDCGDRCDVVLGDARLSLAAVAPGHYDAIVLDAFSSDAIPLHLLTKQALEMYLEKLSDRGVLVFHISNRHLDLRPVVGALARDLRLALRAQLHVAPAKSNGRSSEWVVLARSEDHLGSLAGDSRWARVAGDTRRVWTDDYSDILSVLARR
jgi:spermidine synthase